MTPKLAYSGSQDGNEATTDGVELADLITENETKPVDTISPFYEFRY